MEESKYNDIDVEKIMQEIRSRIKDRDYDEVMPFSEVSEKAFLEGDVYNIDELSYRIEEVHRHGQGIQVYSELNGNQLTKTVDRFIRKSVNFIFKPFAESQMNFNNCLVRALDQIYLSIKENETGTRMASDQEKINFENHDELINVLTNRILQLENKVNELEKELKK